MPDLHQGRTKRAQARIEKLSLGHSDLIIVRDEADMNTFIEMTQQGIGFSPYSNPVLLIRGGLEKATRQDLLEALAVIDQHAPEAAPEASRIITDLRQPSPQPARKVQ
jgi:hypothetical protein